MKRGLEAELTVRQKLLSARSISVVIAIHAILAECDSNMSDLDL